MADKPVVFGVSQPGDLQRGGFAGKDQQTVMPGMAIQVDQYVNLVVPDPVGGLFIRQPDETPPVIGIRFQTPGHFVFLQLVGVAEYFEPVVIVMRQNRLKEIAYRVLPEIAGHVADPEASRR